MKAVVTKKDIESVSVGNKIVSVLKRDGNVNYNLAKYFYNNPKGEFVVITREGIEAFITRPTETIPYVGQKGIHFQSFKSANAAAEFINKLANYRIATNN